VFWEENRMTKAMSSLRKSPVECRTCTLAAEHDIIHELALKRSLWKNGITVISLSGGLGRPSGEIDN